MAKIRKNITIEPKTLKIALELAEKNGNMTFSAYIAMLILRDNKRK